MPLCNEGLFDHVVFPRRVNFIYVEVHDAESEDSYEIRCYRNFDGTISIYGPDGWSSTLWRGRIFRKLDEYIGRGNFAVLHAVVKYK